MRAWNRAKLLWGYLSRQTKLNGLPVEYALYKNENQVPGSYVAVIAPGGSHWFGRAGFVQGGALLAEIIGLDKKIRRQ